MTINQVTQAPQNPSIRLSLRLAKPRKHRKVSSGRSSKASTNIEKKNLAPLHCPLLQQAPHQLRNTQSGPSNLQASTQAS